MSQDAREKICQSAGELAAQLVKEAGKGWSRLGVDDQDRKIAEANDQAMKVAGLLVTALCDLNRIADAAERQAMALELIAHNTGVLAEPAAWPGGPISLAELRRDAQDVETPDEVDDAESRRQACEDE